MTLSPGISKFPVKVDSGALEHEISEGIIVESGCDKRQDKFVYKVLKKMKRKIEKNLMEEELNERESLLNVSPFCFIYFKKKKQSHTDTKCSVDDFKKAGFFAKVKCKWHLVCGFTSKPNER